MYFFQMWKLLTQSDIESSDIHIVLLKTKVLRQCPQTVLISNVAMLQSSFTKVVSTETDFLLW